ncbi:MAG: TrbG/VirB9 family P-type conjugative transfer protein [Bacteroidetes bacterium]|nr:TrbG/VirB9 family P-type conjugative transfer protein [Bacteroidota bacterium]
MKRFLFLLPVFLIPHLVYSQTPPPELIVNPETPLQQAIDQQLQVYAEGGRPEVLKTSNAIIYPFGVYQPVLTCAILRLCVIELEPGEVLLSLGAGDHVRWNIDHGTTGPGGSTIYITISPTDFNLTTNLVISTDRRMYHMTLDSPPRKHGPDSQNPMPGYTRHVMFYYPSKHHVVSQPAEKPNTSTVGTNLDELNYGYSWRTENDFPWVPLAVFDDGERVYLRIPDGIDPGAVLLIGDEHNSRLGSYILRDDFLIIERVFDEARIVLPGPQKRRRFLRRNRQPQRVLILSRT